MKIVEAEPDEIDVSFRRRLIIHPAEGEVEVIPIAKDVTLASLLEMFL